MLRTRVIPCLLLKDEYLYKTIKFEDPTYVGDPMIAIKIFNEKEVDELIFLDITATVEGKDPNYDLIYNVATECFMPFCYGGGIQSIEQIRKILSLGAEKVAINSNCIEDPSLIQEAADICGSQSVVVSIDVKKNFFGKYQVYTHSGQRAAGGDPVTVAAGMEKHGAGEILINSIDRDGTMQGYDIDLVKRVSEAVNVPVIAAGGAGNLEDFGEAVNKGGASAVAAGSMFVFHGKHRAVLINYPEPRELDEILRQAG